MDHTYPTVLISQQTGAPPMYVASITAEELLTWCDVPRAKAEYMAGYQRLLQENRTHGITDYLEQSPQNLVLGAVIVAVDGDFVEVNEVMKGVFEFKVSEDTRDFDTKLLEHFGSLQVRLSNQELASAAIDVYVPGEEDDDDDESDTDYPTSYLAFLAKELDAAVRDWDSIDADRQEAIRNYIEGSSKPGLIIDGQHRVFGAKDVSTNDVALPVILVPGLEHAEQVFQFYVLNSTAKPLKPTELRRIVATSLTSDEIDDLYLRFRQAGVNPEEAQWTYQMNTSPKSPFAGLINFGLGKAGEIIGENVADQLVKGFMKLQRRKYKSLIDPVRPEWDDAEYRLALFFALWNAISAEYEQTWSEAKEKAAVGESSQMFMKVALMTLQAFVLDHIVTGLPFRGDDAAPPFSSDEELTTAIRSVLRNLPQEFFSRKWHETQLDTSEGKKKLYEQMEAVWSNEGKIDARTHSLFRER